MMKNKTLLYSLIALVIGIWFLVIFRINNTFLEKAPAQDSKQLYKAKNEKVKFPEYQLKMDYPDPFFGIKRVKKIRKTNLRKKRVQKPIINNSGISYEGLISGKSGKIGLFRSHGKSFLLSTNDTLQEYDVKAIYRDSAVLSSDQFILNVHRK